MDIFVSTIGCAEHSQQARGDTSGIRNLVDKNGLGAAAVPADNADATGGHARGAGNEANERLVCGIADRWRAQTNPQTIPISAVGSIARRSRRDPHL
jgi:hypothetical protein